MMGGKKPMMPKAPKPVGEVKRNLLPKGEMPMTKAPKPMMPKAPTVAPKGKGMAVSISVGMMKPMKKGKK